jgi:hypothetical protein
MFESYEAGSSTYDTSEQLVELQLRRFRISILGVLNQEDDQERDDGRDRIDYELPRV